MSDTTPPVPAAADPAPDPNAGLIEVAKEGARLWVHPDTLKAHLAAGWRHA
ncbi:protein of unknown function (plasmid) [Rhodovastum atsumiense]|uniref:hypothetical protein n=1 Tax=Rhodovastum atsumiense TaxID=504468 RepID=UPI00139F2AA5|nr:hypothetical protein [Rhodovastum atsumiense]CAH2606423.1 protein of unknown function [Rhodovastum atsumiense]